MKPPHSPTHSALIDEDASLWVMRLDRGLTPGEQDSYLQWLAADPRRAQAMAKFGHTWSSFDRLGGFQSTIEAVPDPDLLRPRWNRRAGNSRRILWAALPLAAAAAVAVVLSLRQSPPVEIHEPTTPKLTGMTPLPPIEERTLEDGSVLRLNRGAAITVNYTATERQIRLERGEASFKVTKDPSRPFVVMTAGVAVRAVGTEFNVHLGAREVDVIVTEGSVALAGGATGPAGELPTVGAGQRALVALGLPGRSPVVTTPPAEELSRRLAWQPRLLTFNDEPLAVILGEFNRHNPVTLRLDDASSPDLRLSARFRSDNVQGFLRLLESEFRVHARARANGEIVLQVGR